MSAISVQRQENEYIIKIEGRFDFNLLQEFREAYSELKDEDLKYIVDLSSTEYVDSSALGMLLNMKNHLGSADQEIEIRNCQPNLKKIFSIAHFDSKFLFT